MNGHVSKLVLNGERVKSKKDFHKMIGVLLNAESYVDGYGYNLDALWDIMSSGAGLNCELHWKNSNISKKNLGDVYFDAIIQTFTEAEKCPWLQCREFKNDIPFKFYLE